MENVKMGMNETYHTSDLYVAAWLLSNGLELQDIDRRNRQRCDFIFADRQDRPDPAADYRRGWETNQRSSVRGRDQGFWSASRGCKGSQSHE